MTLYNDLSRLKSRQHLLRALGLEEALFDRVLAFEPLLEPALGSPSDLKATTAVVANSPAFIRHRIPKKNKARGDRVVWTPLLLKNNYKKLARWLSDFLGQQLDTFPHPAVFGYVRGRNIRENARAHCGHRYLLSTDIADFFPTITRTRIAELFIETGINGEVAELLSRFVTIGGTLPLGLPTSPVISNAIFLPVDIKLQSLAEAHGATYTRYSDDLNLSSDRALPTVDEIAGILTRYQFVLAASKTRHSRRGQAHFVTGLSICEFDQPHIPKSKKHSLPHELY